jgi:hypothetical protein
MKIKDLTPFTVRSQTSAYDYHALRGLFRHEDPVSRRLWTKRTRALRNALKAGLQTRRGRYWAQRLFKTEAQLTRRFYKHCHYDVG